MKRENRYLVLKRSDIDEYLTIPEQLQLDSIARAISLGKEIDNKEPKKYVVVAEDWPMYEDTWKAIEDWIDNQPSRIDMIGLNGGDGEHYE